MGFTLLMLYISGNETDFAVSPLADLAPRIIPDPESVSLRVSVTGTLIPSGRGKAVLGFLTSF